MKADSIRWQEMDGPWGQVCCAAVGGSGKSLCGKREFSLQKGANLQSPTFSTTRIACPDCAARLFQELPEEEALLLPVEALSGDLTLRAVAVAKRLFRRPWVTIGDLTTVGPKTVMLTRACGVVTLGVLQEALRRHGLVFASGDTARCDRRRTEETGQAHLALQEERRQQQQALQREKALQAKAKEAQKGVLSRHDKERARIEARIENFIEKVGLDLLSKGTIGQIGAKVGLSHGGVSRLLKAYPRLRALRGEGYRGAQRQHKAEVAAQVAEKIIQRGETITQAVRELGKHAQALQSVDKNDALLLAAEKKDRVRRKKEQKKRVMEIVNCAMVHGLSFRGACVALGRDQNAESALKVKILRLYPGLLQDEAVKKILDPRAVIREEVEVARQRVFGGMDLRSALEGLGSPFTIHKRLAKDPEVSRLLKHNKRAGKGGAPVGLDCAPKQESA